MGKGSRRSTVQVGDLDTAFRQVLTMYGDSVRGAVESAAKKAVENLAKKTKATAPVGYRGSFRRNISSKLLKKSRNGATYVWFVKAPDHRLTHLLVHGHATRSGGRTAGNPFLQNALNEVLPDYEREVEEAIQNGG